MFKNHLKTAVRSLLRERYYALIKIAGLALGLGTTLVIFLYVAHELSYDEFHPDVDRSYCVLQTNIWDPKGGMFNSTGPAVAFGLVDEFPEIEEVMRVNTTGSQIVRYTRPDGDVVAINEGKVFAADSNFFSFFDFPLKEGDAKTALIGVGKAILSNKAAERLFGGERALGKIILVGDKRTAVEVTGVTEEQPTNVHFTFDYMLSMPTNPAVKEFEWSWIWTQVVTYVKVKTGADVENLNKKLETFADRGALRTFQILKLDYETFSREKGGWKLALQPVRDIHLYSYETGNRLGKTGDIRYVYIFSAIGAFILLIAIINFVNLSTARAAKRAKEVGVKKTLGILRRSLIIQFQVEHILLTFGAMLLGLGVMELLRLIIQPVAGIQMPLTSLSRNYTGIIILIVPIVVGFIAGLYPAFYLTSFKPAAVLKGKLSAGFGNSSFRNVLVVFQFSISIILMVATLVVRDQVEFYRSKDVGFDKENLLIIEHADKLGNQLESFNEEVATFPGVQTTSVSTDFRGQFEEVFMREGDDTQYSISYYKVEEHFFETTGIKLAAGRFFEETRPSDKDAVVLTETTCRLLGWTPEEAIGKRMHYLGDDVGAQEVIGVAKDVHLHSLRQNIAPFMFFHITSNLYGPERIAVIRYQTTDVPALVNRIERRWQELAESVPLSYSFYDESLQQNYKQEERLSSLFMIFTSLSITIAILGLVGLVSYSAEQRKKEIGVRKVFGASLSGIYVMMNKEYLRLIGIALLFAAPISWWLMQQWLMQIPEDNRIEISPFIFVIAFAAELLLALVCVGYLSLKAAALNPTVALKEE